MDWFLYYRDLSPQRANEYFSISQDTVTEKDENNTTEEEKDDGLLLLYYLLLENVR